MKPFRFTLEPLRVIRDRQEREAMERYGQSLMEVNRCKMALADIDCELLWFHEESKQHLVKGALSAHIVQDQMYGKHLLESRKKAIAAIALSEEQSKKALQAMLLARQEREIVDKFREKQHAVYDRAINTEEQKTLDELAGRRLETALSWKM